MPDPENLNTAAVKQLKRRWDEATEHANPYFHRFKRFDSLWEGDLPDEFLAIFQQKEFSDLTHYVPPRAFEIVRGLSRKIFNAMYAVEPNFEFGFYGEKHNHPQADSNRRMVVFQNEEDRGDLETVSDEAIQQMVRVGHCAVVPDWWKKKDNLITSGDKFESQTVYEGPTFTVYPAYQALPSPHFRSLRTGELTYCILLEVIPWGELMDLQKANSDKYSGVENIKVDSLCQEANKWVQLAKRGKLDPNKPEDKKLFPVFVTHLLEGGKRISVANLKYEICNYDNPDKSGDCGVIWERFIKRQGTTFGKGAIEIVEDALYELFEKRWGRLNRMKAQMNPGGITTESQAPSLVWLGSGRWTKVVGDIDNYKQHPTVSAMHEAELKEESLISEEIKRVVGLQDIFAGFEPSQQASATRDISIMEEGGEVIKYTMRPAARLQKRMLRKQLQLNRQLLPAELPQEYQDARVVVKREDILTNWTIRPLGFSTAISRPIMQKMFAMVIEVLTKLPPHIIREMTINWYLLILGWMKTLEPHLRNVDTIFPDPELELIPILKENGWLGQGLDVIVDPREDHEKHLYSDVGHIKFIEELKVAGGMRPEVAEAAKKHITAHLEELERQLGGGSPLEGGKAAPGPGGETPVGAQKAQMSGNLNQPVNVGGIK